MAFLRHFLFETIKKLQFLHQNHKNFLQQRICPVLLEKFDVFDFLRSGRRFRENQKQPQTVAEGKD